MSTYSHSWFIKKLLQTFDVSVSEAGRCSPSCYHCQYNILSGK